MLGADLQNLLKLFGWIIENGVTTPNKLPTANKIQQLIIY